MSEIQKWYMDDGTVARRTTSDPERIPFVTYSDHLAHEAAALEARDFSWRDEMNRARGVHEQELAALRRELTPRETVLVTYNPDGMAALADSSEPVTIHKDFEPAWLEICRHAVDCGVQLHVTHSLRRINQQLVGAIVEQAERSNHHAGHAVDLNLTCDGEWFNSKRLHPDAVEKMSPENTVRRFLSAVQLDPTLRWGGDFSTPDPVHFDSNLVGRDPEAWARCVREIREERDG